MFAGWRQIETYNSGQITAWSKDDVPPAHKILSDAVPPAWQGLLWGILPIGSSILAILLLLMIPDRARAYEKLIPVPAPSREEHIYAREAH